MADPLFLDTYALVEITRGSDKGRQALAALKFGNAILTGSANLYELWYLAAQAKGVGEADRAVLAIKSLVSSVSADDDVCLLAAKLKHAHAGKKIGAVDFITAACAITHNATVLTGDAHFKEIAEAKTRML